MNEADVIFYTLIRSEDSKKQVQLLIESLRAFGGELAQAPVWIFETYPGRISCQDLSNPGVDFLPIDAPAKVRPFFFHDKVFAGARAEELAGGSVGTLIWVAPDCLILQPPNLYTTDATIDAALRPVHIQNVGLTPDQPLDIFWQGIYQQVGLQDAPYTVQTYVDRKTIRAYFNSHAFSVSPGLGLLQRWAEIFEALVSDLAFLQEGCNDQVHRVFLHQAILSALLSGTITAERTRILPPEYNYPYNFQSELEVDQRAARLNDLVTIVYEDLSLDPSRMDAIEIHEPLHAWLKERTARWTS
jgi:hypothetical protein